MRRLMYMSRQILWVLSALAVFMGSSASARLVDAKTEAGRQVRERASQQIQASVPIVEYTAHNRGNIQLAVANNGTFGTFGQEIPDPFTGEAIPSCVYPKNSDVVYLWVASVWVGAIVGRDTLVSTGNEDWYELTEFWPEVKPFGDFQYRSIDPNSEFFGPDAYSEEDILCEYTDTITDPNLVERDQFEGRQHIPLDIKVTQRSMAWSYSYAEDFILFDYEVQNIGNNQLREVYLGIWIDADAWHTSRNGPIGWNDDVVGFYRSHPAPEGCGFIDTVNIAYNADNDGDPTNGSWNDSSATSVIGVRVVRTPSRELQYSFNWWAIDYGDPLADFGPRKIGTPQEPFRDFRSRLGTPEGDRNKYYVMSKPEFDYDLFFTAVNQTQQGWLPPPSNSLQMADGWDTRFLLSFGPFDIYPGQKLPISFAWVAGENWHSNPTAMDDLWDPYNPGPYYSQLDFSKISLNARWASWVYDNPGYDTDGDGYKGEYRVCNLDSVIASIDTVVPPLNPPVIDTNWEYTSADTSYHIGDGVPDFRGAGPPPSPKIKILPSEGKLTIRWNGFYSETTEDIFSNIVDFEGYRVYTGLDDRQSSFSLAASFDREDYNRYVYRNNEWVLDDIPFTIGQLRGIYADPEFEPLVYSINNPLRWGDSSYFFEKQDFNASSLTDPSGIRKAFPSATDPGMNPQNWTEDDVVDYYDEPLPKYYEYELVIEDLLPSIPYYVAVTAFDFGSPASGLEALETDPLTNYVFAYPQPGPGEVDARGLDVYVYPNPYRVDADYRRWGFEGRTDRDRPDDRVRAIHFANLPAKCKISIFSLDGDLVREIDHDKDPGDPDASHNYWNLITRNTQLVVSGLYYYVVESDERTQIGKLMIIM